MLVLRISVDGTTQEIRTRKAELVLGSDPMADVTIAGANWPATALRLRVQGPQVVVETLDASLGALDTTRTLRVGDQLPAGLATVEVMGLIPPEVETPAPAATESVLPPMGQPTPPPQRPGPAASPFELAPPEEAPPEPTASAAASPSATPPASTPSAPPSQPKADPSRRRPALKASPFAGAADEPAPPTPAARSKPPSPGPTSSTKQVRGETRRAATSRARTGRGRPLTPQARQARAAALAAAVAAIREKERESGKRPHEYLGPSHDFGEALVDSMRQAPYFVAAFAAHALLFLILFLVYDLNAPDPVIGNERGKEDAAFIADLPTDASPIEDEYTDDTTESMDPLGPMAMPELEVPEPAFEEPDPQVEENKGDDAGEVDLFPNEETEVAPVSPIGIRPSVINRRVRSTQPKGRLPRNVLEKKIVTGTEDQATRRSAEFLDGAMGRGRGSLGNLRRQLNQDDVLVIGGNFDSISKVLDTLRIPYTPRSPFRLVDDKNPVDLSDYKVVFWNCGDALPPRHIGAPDGRGGWKPGPMARAVREFVAKGGYLFTTDWAIANVVVPAFSDYIGTRGSRAPLPEVNVEIEAAAGKENHPLLRGVFPRTSARTKWWLEKSSFDIVIRDRQKVDVLITSTDLVRSFNRDPAVAVVFRHGKGRVLHCMGHYYQKGGNLAGTIAVHRIALNFVTERLARSSR